MKIKRVQITKNNLLKEKVVKNFIKLNFKHFKEIIIVVNKQR